MIFCYSSQMLFVITLVDIPLHGKFSAPLPLVCILLETRGVLLHKDYQFQRVWIYQRLLTFRTLFFICLWLYSLLLNLGRFLSFLIRYTFSRIPSTGDQPVARRLSAHITTQTQIKRTQRSTHWVGFELTILAFERGRPLWPTSIVWYCEQKGDSETGFISAVR